MDCYLDKDVLYKSLFDETLLRCMNEEKARKTLNKIHEGICDTNTNEHKMIRQIQRDGYFWITMERDYIDYVRKCHKC